MLSHVPPRLSSLGRLALAIVMTTALLAFVPMSSASAHSELLSATPAANSSLTEIPTEIVLEFNEDIAEIGNEVVVTGPSGAALSEGAVVIDGPYVTQAIGSEGSGIYAVAWRAVSADGHPISGEYTYLVDAPQTAAATESAAVATSSEAASTEAATTADAATSEDASAAEATSSGEAEPAEQGDPAPWVLLGIGLAVLVGIAVLAIRRIRAR